jgi:hypothetical protein
MILYFEYSKNGEIIREKIGESRIESVLDMLMHQDMEERGITDVHYLRYWVTEENEIYCDYGSWSSFYVRVPSEEKGVDFNNEENINDW